MDGPPHNKKPRICENGVMSSTFPMGTTNNAYWKTQPCVKFRLGHCSDGSKCVFTHHADDLRNCLPNFSTGSVKFDRFTTSARGPEFPNLCRMFYHRKVCTYGHKCRFLHLSPENVKKGLWVDRDSSAVSIRTGVSSEGCESGFVNSKAVLKKTKFCTSWDLTRSCRFGKLCYFAHGLAELEKPAEQVAVKSGVAPSYYSTSLPLGKDWSGSGHKLETETTESKSKWKVIAKVVDIYADWI